MQRIWVVGSSGSGKTTLARRLASRLSLPHTELDSVYHQADWQPLDLDELRRRIAAIASTDRWVVDGNYSAVADLVWERADTVIWLDLDRAVVLRQVVVRTLRRVWTREVLWNGNRERWRNLVAWDPQESVIRWSWTQHDHVVRRYTDLSHRAAERGTTFVRLRSRSEVDAFLAAGLEDFRPGQQSGLATDRSVAALPCRASERSERFGDRPHS